MPSTARQDTSTKAVMERIVTAAENVGLSQTALCNEADVARSQISATRHRGSDVTWSVLDALLRTLEAKGFRREWLLSGVGPPMARADVGEGASEITARPVRRRRRRRKQ